MLRSTCALPPEQPCGATMCSTQPCLPRAFCTFWTPKTIPQPRNTAPFTSPRASAKHGAALPTHYFCTAPEQPAMMLVMLAGSRLAALHFPSPAPVSLPSIFPPQSRPHPRASRLAPLHLPSPARSPLHLPSPAPAPPIFPPQPQPRPCACALAPLHLPSPAPSPPTRLPSRSPPSSPPPFSVPDNVSFSSLSPELATEREPKHRRCFWEKD